MPPLETRGSPSAGLRPSPGPPPRSSGSSGFRGVRSTPCQGKAGLCPRHRCSAKRSQVTAGPRKEGWPWQPPPACSQPLTGHRTMGGTQQRPLIHCSQGGSVPLRVGRGTVTAKTTSPRVQGAPSPGDAEKGPGVSRRVRCLSPQNPQLPLRPLLCLPCHPAPALCRPPLLSHYKPRLVPLPCAQRPDRNCPPSPA